MATAGTTEKTSSSRLHIIEAIVALALALAAFAAIAASDVSVGGTHAYWTGLVVVFGIAALVIDRMHSGHALTDGRSALRLGLHWVGVFVAIQLVYFFVQSGRMANADTGLTNGVVLALGAFATGAFGNWRFMVIGAALAAATAGVAFVEAYLWVMFGIAVLALAVLLIGSRLAARFRGGAEDVS